MGAYCGKENTDSDLIGEAQRGVSGEHRRCSAGCVTPKTSLPNPMYPIEAEETTRWRQTQNIQKDGMCGCKTDISGKIFFILPSLDQDRN